MAHDAGDLSRGDSSRSHRTHAVAPSPWRPNVLQQYLLAFAAVGAALLLRVSLEPILEGARPYITLFGGIAVAVWLGRWKAAALAAGAGFVAANYFFPNPRPFSYSFQFIEILGFVFSAGFIIFFGEAMHLARERVRANSELLRVTFSSIGDAVIVADARGNVRSLNAEAERLTGWISAQATGRPLTEVFHIVNEQTGQVVENPVEKVLRLGTVVGLANHTVLIARDGTRIPIDDSAAPIQEAGGPLFGVVMVFRDVSGQRAAQYAQARLAAIVETSGDAIITKDLHGVIQTWNAAAEALFGYRAEEVIGKPITIIIPPDRLREEVEIITRLREGQPSERLETYRVTKDGRQIPVALMVSPMHDEDGRIIGASKIIHDISDVVSAREALAEEKERLATTLASIGDAVITTDAAARITFLNAVAEKVSGWSQDEAVGKPLETVFRIINEDTRKTVESPAMRALREGVIMGLANHTILIRKDESMIPIDDSAAPIRDSKGRVVGCVLVFRDITERIRAEKALRDSESRKTAIFAAALDAIVTMDHRGNVVDCNAATERILGYSPRQLIGQPLADFLIPERFRKQHYEGLARYLATGEGPVLGRHLEMSALRADGHEFPAELSIARVPGIEPPLFTGTLRDITERKRGESERIRLLESERNARGEAENASRIKDEFLATLSHELRTPLNAILGWTRLIDKNPGDPNTVQEGIQVIARNAKVQVDLIADLLDMSRIISGKLRLDLQDVNLADVVAAGIDAIRHGAEAKEIAIALDAQAGDLVLRGDSSRLQQVIWNLLSNAVKFTPKGGRIRVRLGRRNSHAQIMVSDTGAGIKPEFLPHLFERFSQGDASASRKHGGLGLGLAIVKHLVELHGGTVRAESPNEYGGATFIVELPQAQQRATPSMAPGGHIEGRQEDGGALCKSIDLRGVRVLAIDDQADAAYLLARVLQECHADVMTASSADEGLKAFEEHRPHIVLCDIGMPGKDGYEFIRELRAQDERTPALAVTAFARAEDKSRALRAGFQAHIAKPFEPSELVAAVAQFAKTVTTG